MEVDSSNALNNNAKNTPARALHEEDPDSGSSSEEGGENGESGESGVESKTSESEGDGDERQNQDEEEWSDETDSSIGTSDGIAPEEEHLLFPAVLPATSIKVMAQAVGCHMPGYVASALGHLAMDKLRRVVIIANQLRKHDQSQGLGVDHFSVAENLTRLQSFGHKTTHALPKFKHIAIGKGVSVMDDSSVRIDLPSTVLHSQNNRKPLRMLTKLSLSDLRLSTTRISSNQNYVQESSPILVTQMDEAELSDTLTSSSSENSNLGDECDSVQTQTSHINSYNSRESGKETEMKTRRNKKFSQEHPTAVNITFALERLLEKILVLNEEIEVSNVDATIENRRNVDQINKTNVPSGKKTGDVQVENKVVVGIEWIDYMKVFISSFFYHSIELKCSNLWMKNINITMKKNYVQKLENREESKANNSDQIDKSPLPRLQNLEICQKDFKLIIEDITSNGAFPVLNVMLNFFGDYMRSKFGKYDLEGLRRILNVLGATLTCSCETDEVYLQKIWEILIIMICLPPANELHQNIAHTFVLLMKKASKDFSVDVCLWISTYITDTLNWCLDSCLHNVNTNVTLFNLALSVGNALEEINIHVALDLGWHVMVLEFIHGLQYLQTQMKAKNINPLAAREEPMDQESLPFRPKEETHDRRVVKSGPLNLDDEFLLQIEEPLMKFFRLFLKNYSRQTTLTAIHRIHEFVFEVYGEKLVPHLANYEELMHPVKRRKTGILNRLRQSTVKKVRSVQWKSKRIFIGKISKRS